MTTLSITEILDTKDLLKEAPLSPMEVYRILKTRYPESKTLTLRGVEILLETLSTSVTRDERPELLTLSSATTKGRDTKRMSGWERTPHGQAKRI